MGERVSRPATASATRPSLWRRKRRRFRDRLRHTGPNQWFSDMEETTSDGRDGTKFSNAPCGGISRREPPLAVACVQILLLLLLSAAPPARAQLVFTFDQAGLAGHRGDTLTFSGTLTNNGTEELFLNG